MFEDVYKRKYGPVQYLPYGYCASHDIKEAPQDAEVWAILRRVLAYDTIRAEISYSYKDGGTLEVTEHRYGRDPASYVLFGYPGKILTDLIGWERERTASSAVYDFTADETEKILELCQADI